MAEETDYRTLIFNFPFYTFETWFYNLQGLIDETKSKADLSEIERIAGDAVINLFVSYSKSQKIEMYTRVCNMCINRKGELEKAERRRKRRQVSEPTSKKREPEVERTSNEEEELED